MEKTKENDFDHSSSKKEDNLLLNSSILLYKQLEEKIQDDIFNGKFKPDERIPSEIELSEIYSISRSTVRKAVEELVEKGLLVKIHGKGTFVAPPKLKQAVKGFTSFSEMVYASGKRLVTKLIDAHLEKATKEDTEFFENNPESQMIVIQRLRSINEKPIMLETNRFTTAYSFLLNENLDGSLYDVLVKKYNTVPMSGSKTIEICYATDEESRLLEISRGSALILINDQVFEVDGKPLYRSKQVIRGDEFKYPII